jgi:starch synthase (maltosyl-transferring)
MTYSRIIIENVRPKVDDGTFAIKRTTGEHVQVHADILLDGHDVMSACVLYKPDDEKNYRQAPMQFAGNDVWNAGFTIERQVGYSYTVMAWVDRFRTWRDDFAKKLQAEIDVGVEMEEGARLVAAAVTRAKAATGGPGAQEAQALEAAAAAMRRLGDPESRARAQERALEPGLLALMDRYPDLSSRVQYEPELRVHVDPPRAACSTWYELFPRSVPGLFGQDRHGTFGDVEKVLPEIAAMGFDVLYLTPIHPIGATNRKGKNNAAASKAGDVGSPWAIGGKDARGKPGGHTAIHPELGTPEEFRHLVRTARGLGVEIALDMAFQCSPDHPWVAEHPQWFVIRADGSIRYAENPPKTYQDVYPFDFDCEDRENLWQALRDIFLHWCREGVRVFRVDNPHTKPLEFWRWCINEVQHHYPDTIYLSEAFSRPKIMYRLAKAGFTQSYTYFTWRNTKEEITRYMTELVTQAPRDFFRPNFWPNTPDILPEFLQYGGRPAFVLRLVLAATLSSNYGVYGPAFELCENTALPGKEEYLDSEKFQLRSRDWNAPGNLKAFIRLLNTIRREHKALQTTWNLRFLTADSEFVLFYMKHDDEGNVLLMVVNLDPYNKQGAWLHLPLEELNLKENQSFLVHDLLGDDKFIWQGARTFLELDPQVLPARIFRVHKQLRKETDFDYFF